MAKSTTFNVVKVKAGAEGKKFYPQVGKLVMRETGNGTLFLHFLDGDFAIFPVAKEAAPAAE